MTSKRVELALVFACTTVGYFSLMDDAHAMDRGQCYKIGDFAKLLQTENQEIVVSANEAVKVPSQPSPTQNKIAARIFTMSRDGSVGYIVQMDSALGTAFHIACIGERMQNVRLYDARKPGVNPATRIAGDREKAAEQCKKINSPCGYHNDALASLDNNDERVMLQGAAVDRQTDGTYKSAGMLTLTAALNSNIKLGGVLLSNLQGTSMISAAYFNLTYAPYALNILSNN